MLHLIHAIRIARFRRFVLRIQRIARMTFANNNHKISFRSHHFVSFYCSSFDKQHVTHSQLNM